MTIIVECAWCRRVKDYLGNWIVPLLSPDKMKELRDFEQIEVSHGICPKCAEVYLGDDPTQEVDIRDIPTRKEVNEDAQTE